MNPCTPGPWHVDYDSTTATVRNDKGVAVARCYQGDDDAKAIACLPTILANIDRELKATFRIIDGPSNRPWLLHNGGFCCYVDAVPDLLAALTECLHRLDEHDPQSVPEALSARAAIKKATTHEPLDP